MKKQIVVILVLVLGTLLAGCATTSSTQDNLSFSQRVFRSSLPEKFIIESDSENSFQGTWLQLVNPKEYGRTVIVIEGTTAQLYRLGTGTTGWTEGNTFYNVNTNPEFSLSEDKNTLQRMTITYNADNSIRSSSLDATYERY